MQHHFGHQIRILHWCTDQIMTDALAQMELTAAQGHIMGFLSHHKEPACASDIAAAFQLSHPTVSGLLSRLEKKGFIEFRRDELDGRARRIYLLPKGLESVRRIEETILLNEQRLVQGFSEEEKKQFGLLLNRSIANMGGNPCCFQKMKEE